MKLVNIYVKLLRESLIDSYKSHKIPVSKVFFNDNLHAKGYNSDVMAFIDVYDSDESFEKEPVLDVPVELIVPTQKFISKDNLESVKDNLNSGSTGAFLVKYGDFYYINDGHHRISNRILNGDKSIRAHVRTVT